MTQKRGPWVREQGGQACPEFQATLWCPAPTCSQAPGGQLPSVWVTRVPSTQPCGCSASVYSMHSPGPGVDTRGPAVPWASGCPRAQLCQVEPPARIGSDTEIHSSSNRIKLPSLQGQQVLKCGKWPPSPPHPQPSLAFHSVYIWCGDSWTSLTVRGLRELWPPLPSLAWSRWAFGADLFAHRCEGGRSWGGGGCLFMNAIPHWGL